MSKKILIIRLSSLGDVILATGMPKLIKEKYPGTRVDFISQNPFADVLRNNSNIDNLYIYSKKSGVITDRRGREIKLNPDDYSFVYDLQKNRHSKRISSKINASVKRIKKNNFKKFLLVRFKINLLSDFKHVFKKYAEVAGIKNISADDYKLEINYDCKMPYNSGKKRLAAIAPGAKHFTKRFPYEKFVEIGEMLRYEYGFDIVLLGSKDETEVCSKISDALSFSVVDMSGKTSILESTALIDDSDLLMCNDSALMHIGSAVGTPLIAIFGSTSEEFGFFPLGGKSLVLQKDLPCRPCTHIGRAECPKGHFDCMYGISESEFREALHTLGFDESK